MGYGSSGVRTCRYQELALQPNSICWELSLKAGFCRQRLRLAVWKFQARAARPGSQRPSCRKFHSAKVFWSNARSGSGRVRTDRQLVPKAGQSKIHASIIANSVQVEVDIDSHNRMQEARCSGVHLQGYTMHCQTHVVELLIQCPTYIKGI